MRVFLGNAPWTRGPLYGVRAGSRWPHLEDPRHSTYMPFPFFLAYAAAVLERTDEAAAVLLVDGCAERCPEADFLARAERFAPDLVLLEVSTASIETDLRVARTLAERLPGVQVVFCGLHVFMQRPEFFAEHAFVTHVLVGEYELSLRELVVALARQRAGKPSDLKAINGLIFRDGADVVRNPPRPVIADLDALPWPARHFLPMTAYRDEPGGIPAPSLQMWASRGCPYKCNFCAWPQIMYGASHTQYRTRDPVDVVDEIEHQIAEYGFKSLYIDDDTFNIGKQRMLAFAKAMKERQLGIPWAVMARADTSDEETLAALADAGLAAIKYGVESGDQDVIKRSGKNLRLDRVRRMMAATHALGINTHLTFTFGLPGETKESVQKTIDLALELDPFSLQFSITTPFPGSRLYEEMDETGMLTSEDWSLYDGYHNAVLRTETLSSADLVHARQRASSLWERYREQRQWAGSGQRVFSARSLGRALRRPDKAIRKLVALMRPVARP